jgi:patatin-like phospholipase/acyl hydrolase
MATSIRKSVKTVHPNGARLLSLDGGGVRGIISLIILDEIMKRVQHRMQLTEMPRPADYFELAGGTSAGGISAIMLFRLGMTTEDAIEEYKNISQVMFRPKVFGWFVPTWLEGIINTSRLIFQNTRFDSTALDTFIDSVVERYAPDVTDKALKGKALLYNQDAEKM